MKVIALLDVQKLEMKIKVFEKELGCRQNIKARNSRSNTFSSKSIKLNT
jgi:hypothetical protein